jgi:rubrerythrin
VKEADKPTKLAEDLNSLIALDLDAIDAHEAALVRLVDEEDKRQLRRFLDDHRRHVTELTALVLEIGDKPVTAPDARRVLATGKVVLLSLGGELGILEAMKSNEQMTNRTYDRVRGSADLPLQARSVVERNDSDEMRHLAWIERRVATLRKGREGVRHA